LEDTADASGLDANADTEDENCEPFCSRAMRLLFGVEELKNVFQLVVIAAIVAAEPPLAGVLEAPAGVAAADDDGALLAAAGAELELLEQADIVAASMRPSTGSR
jgi:hypothetical protein